MDTVCGTLSTAKSSCQGTLFSMKERSRYTMDTKEGTNSGTTYLQFEQNNCEDELGEETDGGSSENDGNGDGSSSSEEDEQYHTDDGELGPSESDESNSAPEGQRRSTRVRRPPTWHNQYEIESSALLVDSIEDVPMSYDDKRSKCDAIQWYEAVGEELRSLRDNDTWELVEVPHG